MNTYEVVITRERDAWLAEVPGLPGAHTYARSLHGLHRAVREVIVLMANLPVDDADAFALTVSFELPDPLGTEVRVATERRRQLRELEKSAREATARAARDLHEHGVSLRDSAEILDVSFQRVQQLINA